MPEDLLLALPFTLRSILRQKINKKIVWKVKYFTMQKYNLKKKPSKRNQNPSRYYYNYITNFKTQHKPKYHLFIKNLI